MSYCVYKHTFPNGKVYIGITCQKPEDRWGNGYGYLHKDNGKYHQPRMANAVVKYGWENIEHEILFDKLNKEEAEQKEIELITRYKSNKKDFGYNVSNGGSSVGKLSDETKKKISNANKGHEVTEETRRKISEANKGKKLSEEHIKKMSEARKGFKHSDESKRKMSKAQMGENNGFYGKRHTEETKKKISEAKMGKKSPRKGVHLSDAQKRKLSEAHKGEKNHNYGKPRSEETKKKISESLKCKRGKYVRCIETGIIYRNQKDAERQTGANQASISAVCRGRAKTAGGYHWEFVEEPTH